MRICESNGQYLSRNLFKNMPDQPFLCLVDVFQERGLVHAHLLCKFAGVYLPGMIEKPATVRFPQDLFLFWRKDLKNPAGIGIVIADRKDLEPPPFLRGILNKRAEVLPSPTMLNDRRSFSKTIGGSNFDP